MNSSDFGRCDPLEVNTLSPAMPIRQLLLFTAFVVASATSSASTLLQPQLKLDPSGGQRVALTLDACDGQVDMRILKALIDNRTAATIFVTGKWLRRNAPAVALLKAHPDLFEVENHGLRHLVPVDTPRSVFGQHSAGSLAGLRAEVMGGAEAMQAAGLPAPHWYRGATAEYSASAIADIRAMGYRVAGFSLNADQGASLGAGAVTRRIASARDGDVIIAHINQPRRASGQGVVAAIAALKARGVQFVKLDQATERGDDATTN